MPRTYPVNWFVENINTLSVIGNTLLGPLLNTLLQLEPSDLRYGKARNTISGVTGANAVPSRPRVQKFKKFINWLLRDEFHCHDAAIIVLRLDQAYQDRIDMQNERRK